MIPVEFAILCAAVVGIGSVWWPYHLARSLKTALAVAQRRSFDLTAERDAAIDRVQVLTAELAARDVMLTEMRRQMLEEIRLIGERIAAGEGRA